MAKTQQIDKDLFKRVRKLGVRRRTAREVAESVAGTGRNAPKAARRVSGDLAGAVAEIQDRLNRGPQKRRAAAKKAAKTRKQRAKRRSEGAKKAVKIRAAK